MCARSNRYVTILYYLAKVWGLAPFILKNNKVTHGSWWTKVYSVIVVGYCVYDVTDSIMMWKSGEYTGMTNFTETTDTLVWIIGILGIVVSVVTFVRESYNIVEIINLFVNIDEKLNFLGAQQDYGKKFKMLAVTVVSASCGIMISDYISITVYWHSSVTFWSLNLMFFGNILYHTIHLVIFIFVNAVLFANERFEYINQILLSLCEAEDRPNFVRQRGNMFGNRNPVTVLTVVDIEMGIEADIAPANNLEPFKILVKIEELHFVLCNVVEKIVNLFSIPLFVIIGYYFMNIVTTFYYLFTVATELIDAFDYQTFIELPIQISWTLVKVVELVVIASACAATKKTGKSTALTLHEMWIRYHPDVLKDEVSYTITYPSPGCFYEEDDGRSPVQQNVDRTSSEETEG